MIKRRNYYFQTQTHPPEYYGGKFEVQQTPGTTHLSVLDRDGLAVSMTSTVPERKRKCSDPAKVIINNSMLGQSRMGLKDAVFHRHRAQ